MVFPHRQYLDSFVNYENISLSRLEGATFKTERVTALLNLFGDPQKKMTCVHVAGTKGKGSTCLFAANILREAGYKTGLYTSPHIYDCTERIRVLNPTSHFRGRPFEGLIPEEDFKRLIEQARPEIDAMTKENKSGPLSFFEILTALGFVYFCEKNVDIAVFETGIGGRLDATNVVDSLVCAITPVSLDHTAVLGPTVEQIAREKAAIIKNKEQTAVVAEQEPEVMDIISKRCRDVQARMVRVGKDIRIDHVEQTEQQQRFHIRAARRYEYLETSLLGRHQAVNAAVAVGIAEALDQKGLPVAVQAVRSGIAQAVWPGRFEIVRRHPRVILDAAHNPASCTMLVRTIEEVFPGKKVVLVFAFSGDKDKGGMALALAGISGEIIFTKTHNPRAGDSSRRELEMLFPQKRITMTEDVSHAMQQAFEKTKKDDIILVTGSLFLVSEAREICLN